MNNRLKNRHSAIGLIEEGLALERRGQEAGAANLPAADATAGDAHEADIQHAYLGHVHAVGEELETQWQATGHEQQEAASELVRENPEAFVSDAEQMIRVTQARHKFGLERAAQDYWRGKRELLGFREKHKVQRLTVRPESLSLHIAILVFLVVIESIANGLVIGQVVEGGILHGVTVATTLAAINIAVSFAFGQWVRALGLFHRNPVRKLLAIVMVLIFVGFLGVYHLSIAHLREAMEAVFATGSVDAVIGGEAYRQAVLRLLRVPFEILNFQGWLLVLVGVGFALSAFFAGMEAKDRYPGFSGVEDRHIKTSEIAHARVLAYVGDLMQGIDEQVTNVEAHYHGVASLVAQQEQLLLVKQHLVETAKRKLRELAEGYALAIAKYRALNLASRTEPAPAFFREPVTAPASFDADRRLAAYDRQLASEADSVAKLVAMKEDLRRQLLQTRGEIAHLQEQATRQGTHLVIAYQEENDFQRNALERDGEAAEPAAA